MNKPKMKVMMEKDTTFGYVSIYMRCNGTTGLRLLLMYVGESNVRKVFSPQT